jgi:RNA polymerase sigma-70 factor (sigma-E family)
VEDEFREFVRGHFLPLRSLAYVTCGDWQTAEDATAAALAKLWRRWSRITTPEAYARTVVVRTALREAAKPWRRERPAGDAMPEVGGPDPARQVDERLLLRTALRQLPPRQRAVLVLRFLEGLSVNETAEVLGCRPGTVKSQCSRGLATLRILLSGADITLAEEGSDRAVHH